MSTPKSQLEWDGPAVLLPRQQAKLGRGAKDQERAMSQTPNTAIAVIGIDIGKDSFHVVGHDALGAMVLWQKWSRGQVEARLANYTALPDRPGSLRRGGAGAAEAAAHPRGSCGSW
jgi:hypothetical protein